MRRFNPEKELSKIRNGNKKKIIISICALLVVGVLGYSFALYQVRHTQKLAFNTVSEFKKRDIYLSVLVDGEYKNDFPNQEDGYAFSGYECDGDATVTFDPDKWIASVNSNGPDKCTIKFGTKNINYDTLRIKEDILVDETNDANLRYVGADPSNYIWFNCDSYDGLTNETAEDEEHQCERWRIIGLMNNMTIVDEDTDEETSNQSLVKIIRNESLGGIAWNNIINNDWTTASLQNGLNTKYLNNEDNGEWITSKEYSTDSEDENYLKDPSYKAISELTKGMIENTRWYLSGTASQNLTALNIYKVERVDIINEDYPTIWDGKIGLVYPSDYGFATNGSDEGTSREECLKTGLYGYNNGCRNKDWLFKEILAQWTITRNINNTEGIFFISTKYSFDSHMSIHASYTFPTLYLKPNVKILDGEGTNEKPYIINVE